MAPPRVLPDRVEPAKPESGFVYYIFSQQEKQGWQARVKGDRFQQPHPGSAIDYKDALYEVLEIGPAEGTPYTYKYSLGAWEDRFVARKVFPFSLERARAEAVQVQAAQKQHQQHTWAIYWFALTGALPTPLAQRWEREWGLPMKRSAIISLFILSAVSMTVGPALYTQGHTEIGRFFLLLQFEQMIRFFWLLGGKEAVGSFYITSIWGIWNLLRGRKPDGTLRRRRTQDYAADRDEVRVLSEQPWDIEVHTIFRDPLLLGPLPVMYSGQVYQPAGYIQVGEGLSRRYVFRLKRTDDEKLVKIGARREYKPERDEKRVAELVPYERHRNWVHSLGFMMGFLPKARQMDLQETYEYDAALWSKRTALVMLLAGGAQLWFFNDTHSAAGTIIGIYIVLESIYRSIAVITRGLPIGSAFGWLLYPFVKY